MTDAEGRILERVRAGIGAELMDGAIVYLAVAPLPAGGRVTLGGVDITPPWPARLAFVDLEPGVNWGHDCRYLLIREDAAETQSFPATMPPFLKPGGPGFRVLWRGPGAPEWAVEGDSG